MNQPASKDPSMDEILSSIRQIIADDEPPVDEPVAEPEALATEITADDEGDDDAPIDDLASMAAQQPVASEANDLEEEPLALGLEQMLNPPRKVPQSPDVEEGAPLALSVEQMLNAPSAPQSTPTSTDPTNDLVRAAPAPEEYGAEFGDDVSEDVQMVVPDDIAFINDDDTENESVSMDLDDLVSDVDLASLDAVAEPSEPEPVVEEGAPTSPLPDPTLTTQMSEELLEPATQAAASSAFSQLDALTLSGGNGQTVEDLIREMLRPMLKGWLDENLPGVVEKLVQREIERVSRGNR